MDTQLDTTQTYEYAMYNPLNFLNTSIMKYWKIMSVKAHLAERL